MQDDTLSKFASVRDSKGAHQDFAKKVQLYSLVALGVVALGLLFLAGDQCRHLGDAAGVMCGLLAYPALPRRIESEQDEQDAQDTDSGFPLTALLQSIFQSADGVMNAKTATFAFSQTTTDQNFAGKLQRGFPTSRLLHSSRIPLFHWWRSDWQTVAIVNTHDGLNLSGFDRNGKKLVSVPNTLKPTSIWSGPFSRLVIVRLQPDQAWEGFVSFCDPEFPRGNLAAASLLQRITQVAVQNYEAQSKACAQARMEERLRIARDLHDGVMQSLSISAMRMEEMRRYNAKGMNAKSSNALAEAHQLLTEEIRRLRLQTEQLRTGLLNEPLIPYMAEVIKEFERRTGITTFFTYDVNVDIISKKLALDLVYMVREGLSNVYKHSHSKFVEVDLTGTDDVHLTIHDYGRGVDIYTDHPAGKTRKYNECPRVLHERVSANGGTLLVESHPQHGTRLTINIPLEEQQSPCPCPDETSHHPFNPGLLTAADYRRKSQSPDLAELRYFRKK